MAAKIEPDWKLSAPDAMEVYLRIELHRRGVTWGEHLETHEQWNEMCGKVIDHMRQEQMTGKR